MVESMSDVWFLVGGSGLVGVVIVNLDDGEVLIRGKGIQVSSHVRATREGFVGAMVLAAELGYRFLKGFEKSWEK